MMASHYPFDVGTAVGLLAGIALVEKAKIPPFLQFRAIYLPSISNSMAFSPSTFPFDTNPNLP